MRRSLRLLLAGVLAAAAPFMNGTASEEWAKELHSNHMGRKS